MNKQKQKAVLEALLQSDPVQNKLQKVARRWSQKTETGKPEYDEQGIDKLREAMAEEGMDTSVLDPKSVISEGDSVNLTADDILGGETISEVSIHSDTDYVEDYSFVHRPPRKANDDESNIEFLKKIRANGYPVPEGKLKVVGDPDEINDNDVYKIDLVSGGLDQSFEEADDDDGIYKQYIEDVSGNVYKNYYSGYGSYESNFLTPETNPDSIDWGAATFETAACLGVAMKREDDSPEKLIQEFQNGSMSTMDEASEIKDTIIQYFNHDYDWESDGTEEIDFKLNGNPPISDLPKTLKLAQGTYDFIEDEVGFENPQFIHGSIKEYYAAEEQNENLETRGDKDNTADFVITNTDPDNVFNEMENDNAVEAYGGEEDSDGNKGVCYFTDSPDIKFVQVSHKEKLGGGSQLGKFVRAFRKAFGLQDTEVLDDVALEAREKLDLDEQVIQEGVIDTITDFVGLDFDVASVVRNKFDALMSYAQDKGQIVVNKFRGGIEAIRKNVYNFFQTEISKVKEAGNYLFNWMVSPTKQNEVIGAEKTFFNRIRRKTKQGRYRGDDEEILEESKLMTESGLYSDLDHEQRLSYMKRAWNNLSLEDKKDVFEHFYSIIRENKKEVKNAVEKEEGFKLNSIPDELGVEHKDRMESETKINHIYATYQAFTGVKNMVQEHGDKVRDAKDVMNKFADLQAKMVFGKTTLPVWKVSQSKSKYLETEKSYREDKANFLDDEEAVELQKQDPIVIRMAAMPKSADDNAASYAASTQVYVASGFDRERKSVTYTSIEFRAEGHEFSFTVSGKEGGKLPSEIPGAE